MLPKKISTEIWDKGPVKTRERDITPPNNSLVVVKHNNLSKEYKTDYNGKFSLNVIDDFKLIKFKESKELDFTVYMNNHHIKVNGWKSAVTLSSKDWTNKYVRVISPNAKIKNYSGNFLRKPLLGTIYPTKTHHKKDEHKIAFEGRSGFIDNEDVDVFYKYGDIEKISIRESIEQFVQAKVELWQQKGEFENTAQYRQRLQSRNNKAREFINDAMLIYSKDYSKSINWNNAKIVGKYDADSELFKIKIDDMKEIFLKVPLDSAQSFKQDFNEYGILDPKFQISEAGNSWELTSVEFFNETDSIGYNYQPGFGGYNPVTGIIAGIDVPDIDVVFDENEHGRKKDKTVKKGFNDNGYNIEYGYPKGPAEKNKNAFAIIIGNSKYKNAENVDFATNDARSIKAYLKDVLGYDEANIEYYENAAKSDFDYLFGTANYKGRLADLIKPDGSSEIFIFYSGHGAPGSEDNNKGEPYFVPVDARPAKLSVTGYDANLLYNNLASLKASKKTVVIDACFSGEKVVKNVSSLGIEPKETDIDDPNLVIFSSSSSTEYSTWFNAKQHGMFTYFFLKAIHNKDVSDTNKDGNLSYNEIFKYIKDGNNGLPYVVRRIHEGRTQTPTIKGSGSVLNSVFMKYND